MFTNVKSARTAALAALTALSVAAVPAAPALAMGDKEKGFVAGALTAVIVDEMLKQGRKGREERRAPVYAAPPPVYYAPPTHSHPAPVAATSIHATPVARAFNTYSPRERQAIQRSLRASGYYSGAIDGSFGPRTYNAVVAYARDAGARRNLQTTGGAFAIYDGLIF